MADSKRSPRRVEAGQRRLNALTLRKAGFTFEAIGQALGISPQRAFQLVDEELRAISAQRAEQATELVRMEQERLDELQAAVWAKAKGGDLDAIAVVLKISARRSKLLGLDAPTKIAPTSPDGKDEYRGRSPDLDAFAQLPVDERLRILRGPLSLPPTDRNGTPPGV